MSNKASTESEAGRAVTGQSEPGKSDVGENPGRVDPAAELTLSEAQRRVDEWIESVGVRYFSELTNLAQLVEEVGEVARILSRTYGDQSFKAGEEDASLADEMGDVLFVLLCLANQTGVDLTAALEKNLERKAVRDAERHQSNQKLR